MSGTFLSQEEVDAMMGGGAPPPSSEEIKDVLKGEVRDYDMASQDRIVRGKMPTLELINERFARALRVGIFDLVRRAPEITVSPIKVQKYSDFIRRMVVPTSLNIMAVRPLRGYGLVVCEPTLLFGVIDALFGGKGKFQARIEGRDFSATEQKVISRLVNIVSQCYAKAWKGVYPIELVYQRSEMQPQFVSVITPNEQVVTAAFKVELGSFSGNFHVCIPYATFEPIRDLLYSTMQSDGIEPDKRWVGLLSEEIKSAEVELVSELVSCEVTLEQLMSMKVGDLIEFERPSTVQANIEGVPVVEAEYGAQNGKYALRVTQVLRSASASGSANS